MKRLRRSMLFVPGNNPGMIRDAHIYGSDSIMFDLEDSVSINEKDAARFLVYNALSSLRYGKISRRSSARSRMSSACPRPSARRM